MDSEIVPNQSSPTGRRRWLILILAGALFEGMLLGVGKLLPENPLVSEISKLGQLIHSLWLRMRPPEGASDKSAPDFVWPVIYVPGMSLFWAFLFHWLLRSTAWLTTHVLRSKRQRLIVWGGVGIIVALVFAWIIAPAPSDIPTPFIPSPEVESLVGPLVQDNTAFAIDLYQKLKQQPGNLFFSPYSISSGLAMAYAGAQNQTAYEMATVLHFDVTPTNFHAAFGALTERLNQVQRRNRITLMTANALWCQEDHEFQKRFLDLVRIDYDGTARPVDFRHSSEAADEINDWVDQKTRGKIKNIILPEGISTNEALILCNAIYFKGKWQQAFRPADTRPGKFKVNTNNTVAVPMMRQESQFKINYCENHEVEMIDLPYTGNDLSMIVILPVGQHHREQPMSLPALESLLTAENLSFWLRDLDHARTEDVAVALPRFTFTQTLSLTKTLESMGMAPAFGDGADFSGMDESRRLKISDVVHHAFIDVNEAGTEAAATTVIEVQTLSIREIEYFTADHPFIFLIRDNGTGTILFLGRVVDPRK